MKFLIITALLISLLTIMGCAPKEGDLNGQIFIVTKGRDNIRLALVDVNLFTEQQMKEYVILKKQQTKEKIKEVEAFKHQLIGYIEAIKNNNYSKQNLYGETIKATIFTYVDKDGISHFTNILPFLKTFRMVKPTRHTIQELEQAYAQAELLREALLDGAYFFENVPSGIGKAKTDVDGKFTFRINRSQKYALIASAERKVVGKMEKYYWIIWTSLEGKESKTIMLSNDNLLKSGSADSVIKLSDLQL